MQETLNHGWILMGYGITGVFLVLLVFYAAIKLFSALQIRSARKKLKNAPSDLPQHSQK